MATLYDAEGNPVEIDDSILEPDDRRPQNDSEWKMLRKANEATKKAEQDAAAAKRSLAFHRAGIDPDATSGLSALFVKAYDGDSTPEAIREAAISMGVMAPPAATQQDQQQQEDLATAGRISEASGSQQAAPTADQSAVKAMADAYAKGGMDALTDAMGAMGIPRQID